VKWFRPLQLAPKKIDNLTMVPHGPTWSHIVLCQAGSRHRKFGYFGNKKRLTLNFDHAPRSRNEVQKNKLAPTYQTEYQNPKKIAVFRIESLLFLTKYGS
jgi:hypothetical protein